jgi:hypothetical protein
LHCFCLARCGAAPFYDASEQWANKAGFISAATSAVIFLVKAIVLFAFFAPKDCCSPKLTCYFQLEQLLQLRWTKKLAVNLLILTIGTVMKANGMLKTLTFVKVTCI